ncbi:MAG: SDR family NAD(P)-dependent oxidoreductase [Anaerolineales bacterium]
MNTAPLTPSPRAVLIGASSGIGAALARQLAANGYTLALTARRLEKLTDLCAEINAQTGRESARPYPNDVTAYHDAAPLLERIIADLGGLDAVIYNAGVLHSVTRDEYNFEKDRAMLETNLLGALAWLNPTAALFEQMGRGQIVGISSIAGARGRVGSPAYNTSKAGLDTYLESLRNRLTRHGVNVLTVRPGYVQTEMIRGATRAFWVIPAEQAAADIAKAMQRRKQVIYTPARWWWVALALKHMPSVIFRRLNV